MERLVFLPVAIATALISIRLDLTYAGLAVLVGIVIPLVSLVRGEDMFSTATLGYLCVFLGIALLTFSYFVCNHYGISFEALDHDWSFPRVVRRSPYFGIAFLSTGATTIAISILKKR
jgi:Na+/melibiose symporter-like transporter